MQTTEFPDIKEGLEYRYYCRGKWEKSISGNTIPIRNPYNDELVGKIQACSKEEVDKVITTAQENLDCWIETPLNKRIEVLRKSARIIRESMERKRYEKKSNHFICRHQRFYTTSRTPSCRRGCSIAKRSPHHYDRNSFQIRRHNR